ncbi:uncharacterized protein LOC129779093 [Toxorhynchites rutilus septentrionalis]|uniref:uncharacterized protein LOC129779093 n=1 Tax=Toxorhynchites rutilus septentrionalis TaxID=329112 RepID=UPI00247AEA17|nr:uncharacterized protein LOC129779093 [Toxorhynchites rutilus septentrionalis]
MKHQQVVPDYVHMLQTSGTVLCLVVSGWVLFRLVQAVFWLPGYLEKTQGKLYEHLEIRSDMRTQSFNTRDSVDEKTDAGAEGEGNPQGDHHENDDASVECGSKKDN